MIRRAALALLIAACANAAPAPAPNLTSSGGFAPPTPAPSPSPAPSAARPPARSPFGSEEADQVLFGAATTESAARAACRGPTPEPDRIRCLIALRFRADATAASLALDLFDRTGALAGTERDSIFDGGYRGPVHVIPALPLASERAHLVWVDAAFRDFDAFFEVVPSAHYRYRDLALRFFRSVAKRTPSAYASGWTIAYNLNGAINVDEESVRETLFHELFHLNDEFHDHWAKTALTGVRDAIMRRCHGSTACLTPYAPSSTQVRGSTYYAFHPGNGADEYGAELALRYYREERAAIRGAKLAGAPFKCANEENARAWAALVAEFFEGYDVTAPCAGASSDAGPSR